MPLVQINPTGISLSDIASGRYDDYLTSYAQAVRAYRHPVILELWSRDERLMVLLGLSGTHLRQSFVAAWRHIVTLFRTAGNPKRDLAVDSQHYQDKNGRIPSPAPWWPGSSYVTWVGIDGYYLKSVRRFVPLFGPTIVAVRELTGDPILIAETGATPAASQPAKIADLFAGIHTYGLLGFVWFDANRLPDYRLSGHAAIAAFRRGAKTY